MYPPRMIAEYDRYDALGLAELVRKGDVTSAELIETCIARIEAMNPKLHCIVDTLYERARRAAEQPLKGPFMGVPFLIKDLGAEAVIGDAWVAETPDGPAFNFGLTRTGSRSVYGDIEVTRPGASEPLLRARGIAVYPEVGAREVSLRVPPELAAKLKGPVRIRYTEDREVGGGTIDEAERVVK